MLELQRLQNKTIEIKKVKMMKSQIQKDKYKKKAAANCEMIHSIQTSNQNFQRRGKCRR